MAGFGRHNPVEREVIGYVSVDSGTVLLTDPCYVDEGFSYSALHEAWGNFNRTHIPGPNGFGVVVQTAWGDGSYPVIAEIQEGRVMRITVEFDEYLDEEEVDE